ncbi:peptidase S8/S53 domain-containing protein, partial [Catenaria anguillulae PL171]
FNFPDNAQGRGVDVYVIDSGLDTNHTQFAGRAAAFDLTGNRNGTSTTTDPNGHGSHVAGIIGGTISGVAKQVNLIGLQVFDASGRGSNAAILQALQSVSNKVKENGNRPAVVNMSLGGPRSQADGAFQRAIESLIQQGIAVVAAAGNSAQDACTVSPAFIPSVITVAAANTTNDQLATFSNVGSCVSIIAPGVDVPSVRAGTKDGLTNKSGTSMASPFVAGVMAALMSTGLNAETAKAQLLGSAQKGIMGGNLKNTTNTFLLFDQNLGQNRNGNGTARNDGDGGRQAERCQAAF